MRTVFISDKTLCVPKEQGKQPLTFRERTSIAKRLEEMGVDAIILPQMERVREETIMNRTICTAATGVVVKIATGITQESVAQAWECVKDAKKPCLQVVIPISTVQMEYQYHKKAPAMLAMLASLVKDAAALCPCVEVVATDASRAEEGFLAQVCQTAKENGACAVTLCDNAGVWMPEDMQGVVAEAKGADVAVYICPSNTLHMATAVAMAALKAGADGVVTATSQDALSVEALCDVLTAKGESIGVTCGLSATEIHRDMEDLQADGLAGITAKAEGDHRVRLTLDSTLADVLASATALGYDLSEGDAGLVAAEVRRMADHKPYIGARDLEAIIATTAMQVPSTYHLDSYVCTSGNIVPAMAQITLTHGGESTSGVSRGDGPIDAAFMAIEQIIGHHYELDDFQIQAVTEGRGAIGSALVKLRSGGKLYSGSGVSTDIIGASIRAYVNALNKIVYEEA